MPYKHSSTHQRDFRQKTTPGTRYPSWHTPFVRSKGTKKVAPKMHMYLSTQDNSPISLGHTRISSAGTYYVAYKNSSHDVPCLGKPESIPSAFLPPTNRFNFELSGLALAYLVSVKNSSSVVRVKSSTTPLLHAPTAQTEHAQRVGPKQAGANMECTTRDKVVCYVS